MKKRRAHPKEKIFSPPGYARHAAGSHDVLYKDYPDRKYPAQNGESARIPVKRLAPAMYP